jgi:hypothetical protein
MPQIFGDQRGTLECERYPRMCKGHQMGADVSAKNIHKFMKSIINKFLIFIAMIAMACQIGCNRAGESNTKVLYSGNLINKYNLTVADLKSLQFYLAGPVTLTRQVARDYKVDKSMGRLVERDGVMFEEISIPSGTAGLFSEAQNENYGIFNMNSRQVLFVSFHPGTSFRFVGDSDGYWPMQVDSDNDVVFFENVGGNWQNTNYRLNSKLSNTRLTVDEDSLRKVEKTQRTLKGVRLPDSK